MEVTDCLPALGVPGIIYLLAQRSKSWVWGRRYFQDAVAVAEAADATVIASRSKPVTLKEFRGLHDNGAKIIAAQHFLPAVTILDDWIRTRLVQWAVVNALIAMAIILWAFVQSELRKAGGSSQDFMSPAAQAAVSILVSVTGILTMILDVNSRVNYLREQVRNSPLFGAADRKRG